MNAAQKKHLQSKNYEHTGRTINPETKLKVEEKELHGSKSVTEFKRVASDNMTGVMKSKACNK